ncbi:MAG: protein containing von Willebrand factor type (vWA) domain [Holophagaceae bacterium]|nr:protein containing von Willebrand factor type (vWA) domain [Holophagaceae bacterium]
MEYIILDLARTLRQAGHPISSTEIQDCLKAVGQLRGAGSRSTLCTLLNATLLKAEWGRDYLLRLLDLYFEAQESDTVTAPVSSVLGTGMGSVGAGEASEQLVDAVRRGQPERLAALIRALDLQPDLLSEDDESTLARLREATGWFKVARGLDGDLREGRLTPDAYAQGRSLMEEWTRLLLQEMDRLRVKTLGMTHLVEILRREEPRHVAFREADARMLDRMKAEVEKLARKLAVRRGRRWKPGLRGRIDPRRVTRKAMQTGGVPLHLCQSGRKLVKPDLWLLCDVSNSVRQFSYFMLLLVHTIQNRFSHIRSFLFVDRLLEVTEAFREDWEGLDELSGHSVSGFSHYGEVLRAFSRMADGKLGADTTLLILGDARNNWNRMDGSELLGDLRRQARAVYWLNPMKADEWGRDDCVMARYAASCTDVFSCSNLEELEQVLFRIL